MLCVHSGWTRARLNQGSAVGWSGGNGGQGTGPDVRFAAGTDGGDGSGLLGAAALGARARGTHTATGVEAGHDYWWRTAREAWGGIMK